MFLGFLRESCEPPHAAVTPRKKIARQKIHGDLRVGPAENVLELADKKALEEAPRVHRPETEHEDSAHRGDQPACSALFIGRHGVPLNRGKYRD